MKKIQMENQWNSSLVLYARFFWEALESEELPELLKAETIFSSKLIPENISILEWGTKNIRDGFKKPESSSLCFRSKVQQHNVGVKKELSRSYLLPNAYMWKMNTSHQNDSPSQLKLGSVTHVHYGCERMSAIVKFPTIKQRWRHKVPTEVFVHSVSGVFVYLYNKNLICKEHENKIMSLVRDREKRPSLGCNEKQRTSSIFSPLSAWHHGADEDRASECFWHSVWMVLRQACYPSLFLYHSVLCIQFGD